MAKRFRAKTFKSGNSVALRLPKNLGIGLGEEIVIVPHEDGSFSFWNERDAKALLLSLFGSMSDGFMSEGRGDIDQDEREWREGRSTDKAA